ncbi:MAG: hypothetical protein QG557_1210 [Pseudomonadota bacterium]|nr:hypothetical protein [Pseudomonadota bacterium]
MKTYWVGFVLFFAQTVKAELTCISTQMLNADKTACVALVCTAPQVINVTKTACFTPPICSAPDSLNLTQTACIKPKMPVCTPPKILNQAKITCIDPIILPTAQNTKPVLNPIAQEWDVNVGELLTVPLVVNDAQQDEFTLTSTLILGDFSAVHNNDENLPTVDFLFTPTQAHGNKIYTTTFHAKETKTTQHYVSNKIAVKIRVWPSANHDIDSATQLIITSAQWQANYLTIEGQVVLNSLLTQQERQTFIDEQFDLIIRSPEDNILHIAPLALSNQGLWKVSFSLPLEQTPCHVVLEFNTRKARHEVLNAPLSCFK